MKKFSLILLILFISISIIQNAEKEDQKMKNKENNDTHEINIDLNSYNTSTNDTNDDEDEDEEGIYISDEVFDKKLKRILKKRNLKPKKKISKEILHKIFNEIFTKKVVIPTMPNGERNIEQEKEIKRYKDELFYIVARGLDYDDKIRVSEIKNWISPKRTQEALKEMLTKMEDLMKDL